MRKYPTGLSRHRSIGFSQSQGLRRILEEHLVLPPTHRRTLLIELKGKEEDGQKILKDLGSELSFHSYKLCRLRQMTYPLCVCYLLVKGSYWIIRTIRGF